jgi:exopolyphosphatase
MVNPMPAHELNRYLMEAKTDINHKSIDYLVMGNEAADLDSMASAVGYAYFLAATKKDKTIVPVMPIPRADFKLRTEAVYVFYQAGIDLTNLIFLDDMDFEAVLKRVAGLVLVDHNQLSGLSASYGDKVAIILDHHKNENLYPHAAKKQIEPVGSTTTLVGEELITHCPDLVDPHLALLLWGTILLDTVNLDPGAGRVTPRDEKIAGILMKSCPLGPAEYFDKVQKAKFNTVDLGTFDLLRKDYKQFQSGKISWGIASVLLPLVQWGIKDSKLCVGFEAHAHSHNLDLLFSMNAFTDKGFSRNLAVYSKETGFHDQLIEFLQEKNLDLTPVCLKDQKPCLEGKISFHRQGNPGISRKKLSPLLADYLHSQNSQAPN